MPTAHKQGKRCRWCVKHNRDAIANNAQVQAAKTTADPSAVAVDSGTPNMWRYSGWKAIGEQSKLFNAFAVYVVLCYDDVIGEKFIKIGKTFQTVSLRMRDIPYKWTLLAYLDGEATEISMLERAMHKMYKEYKYYPTKKFGGWYECFSIEMLNNIPTHKD